MNNSNNKKEQFSNTPELNSDILNAAKSGDKKALFDKLSIEDKEKLNQILNDKQQLENILKSPMAAALLKALGGKNG